MNKNEKLLFGKNIFGVILVLLILVTLFALLTPPQEKNSLPLTQIAFDISQGKVEKITLIDNKIIAHYKDGKTYVSSKEEGVSLFETLKELGVSKESIQKLPIEIKSQKTNWMVWATLLGTFLPLIIIGWFFWMLFKQAKRGAMQTFDFTRAKA